MSKVLIAICMATHSVWSLVYEVFDTSKLAVEGLVCPLAEKDVFSFLTKQVECTKIKNLETLCEKEGACKIIAFPKVENTYLDKVAKDPAETCTVYFENLLKVDLTVYWNSASLVRSFYALLDELLLLHYVSPFEISADSFALQPSTQSFAFIDFDKLTIDDAFMSKRTQVSKGDEKTFKDKMAETFSESLNNQKIKIEKSNLYGLGHSNFINHSFSNNLQVQVEIKQKKTVATFPKLSPGNHNALIISYPTTPSSDSISFKLNLQSVDFVRDITFYDPKEMFILYICQSEGNYDDCYPVSKSDFVNQKIETAYKDKLIFEVKIREGSYFLEGEKDQVPKRLFEFFVNFVEKEKGALTPTEILIFKNDQKDALKDDDIILCETSKSFISIRQFNKPNAETKWSFILTNKIDLEKDQNIYQIAPSYLTPDFEHCFKPDTKVFLIRGTGKKVYIVSNKESSKKIISKLESVHIRPTDGESELVIINNCPPDNQSNLFLFNESLNRLNFGDILGVYPSEIIFKNADQSHVKLTSTCRYKNKEALALFYLKFDDETRKNFFFNFNLQPETSPDSERKSIVYLNTDPEKKNPEFSFGLFAWPKTESYTIFFSFYKSQDGKSKIMQAVYFNKERNLVNIPFDTPMKESDQFPKTINLSKTVLPEGISQSNTTFGDMQTVYLSDTEIVYQFNVLKLDQCIHLLKFNDKDRSLKLNCTSSSKNDIIIRKVNIPRGLTGLTKVLNQASNGAFGKQGELI